MTPKTPAKADRTPLEGETQEQADRRADDQDAAMEAAFLAGTLPEEDRREPVPVPPEPTLEDGLLALPVGSSATFVRGHDANHWTVQHGNGPITKSHTFDRARRLHGAQQVHDPDSPAGFRLIDAAGNTIDPD